MEVLGNVLNPELLLNHSHTNCSSKQPYDIVEWGAGQSSCVISSQEGSAPKDFFTKSEELEKEYKKKLLKNFLKDKRKYLIKVENKENIYDKDSFAFKSPANLSLDDYDQDFLFNQELLKLKQKQIFDDEEHSKSALCNDCGNVLKRKAVILHSFSRYSSNEGNIKAMICKYSNKLKTIFRKVKRVKEFFVSYAGHPAYFKSLLSDYRKLNNLLFKEVEKLGIYFPCLQVVDFRIEEIINSEGKKLMWRVHFHFLAPNVEQKFFDGRVWKKAQKEVEKQTGVYPVVGFGKYEKKNKKIRYFAKTMAGLYSLNEGHHNTLLNEIVDDKEYLLNFFGMRSYDIRAKKGDVLINFDKPFFDWLCSSLCLLKFQICPFCHSTHIIFLTPEKLKDFKPPDPNIVVETIRNQQKNITSPLEKRFSRWSDLQEGKHLNKSDLDLTDNLNLLAFNKC